MKEIEVMEERKNYENKKDFMDDSMFKYYHVFYSMS